MRLPNIKDGMIGFKIQPGVQNEFLANKSWYRPNALEELEYWQQLAEMSHVRQLLSERLKQMEAAKRSTVRGPVYSKVVDAAELAAKHPLSETDLAGRDQRAKFSQELRRISLERLGVWPGMGRPNNVWLEAYNHLRHLRKKAESSTG